MYTVQTIVAICSIVLQKKLTVQKKTDGGCPKHVPNYPILSQHFGRVCGWRYGWHRGISSCFHVPRDHASPAANQQLPPQRCEAHSHLASRVQRWRAAPRARFERGDWLIAGSRELAVRTGSVQTVHPARKLADGKYHCISDHSMLMATVDIHHNGTTTVATQSN